MLLSQASDLATHWINAAIEMDISRKELVILVTIAYHLLKQSYSSNPNIVFEAIVEAEGMIDLVLGHYKGVC